MPEKVLKVIWDEDSGEVVKLEGLDKFNSTELMDIREELIRMLDDEAGHKRGRGN